jgi:hypothetical protein
VCDYALPERQSGYLPENVRSTWSNLIDAGDRSSCRLRASPRASRWRDFRAPTWGRFIQCPVVAGVLVSVGDLTMVAVGEGLPVDVLIWSASV